MSSACRFPAFGLYISSTRWTEIVFWEFLHRGGTSGAGSGRLNMPSQQVCRKLQQQNAKATTNSATPRMEASSRQISCPKSPLALRRSTGKTTWDRLRPLSNDLLRVSGSKCEQTRTLSNSLHDAAKSLPIYNSCSIWRSAHTTCRNIQGLPVSRGSHPRRWQPNCTG